MMAHQYCSCQRKMHPAHASGIQSSWAFFRDLNTATVAARSRVTPRPRIIDSTTDIHLNASIYAHISRGDAFYVTLVCSLANFLERLRSAVEPEDTPAEDRMASGRGGAPPVLIYGALTLTSSSCIF